MLDIGCCVEVLAALQCGRQATELRLLLRATLPALLPFAPWLSPEGELPWGATSARALRAADAAVLAMRADEAAVPREHLLVAAAAYSTAGAPPSSIVSRVPEIRRSTGMIHRLVDCTKTLKLVQVRASGRLLASRLRETRTPGHTRRSL